MIPEHPVLAEPRIQQFQELGDGVLAPARIRSLELRAVGLRDHARIRFTRNRDQLGKFGFDLRPVEERLVGEAPDKSRMALLEFGKRRLQRLGQRPCLAPVLEHATGRAEGALHRLTDEPTGDLCAQGNQGKRFYHAVLSSLISLAGIPHVAPPSSLSVVSRAERKQVKGRSKILPPRA